MSEGAVSPPPPCPYTRIEREREELKGSGGCLLRLIRARLPPSGCLRLHHPHFAYKLGAGAIYVYTPPPPPKA